MGGQEQCAVLRLSRGAQRSRRLLHDPRPLESGSAPGPVPPRDALRQNYLCRQHVRSALTNIYTAGATPFASSLTSTSGTQYVAVNSATLFVDTAAGILDFFQDGQPNIDRTESLMVRRILDAAEQPAALKEFVPL